MEDIITTFDLASTQFLPVCPCCGGFQDKAYDLSHEQRRLAEPWPKCGYHRRCPRLRAARQASRISPRLAGVWRGTLQDVARRKATIGLTHRGTCVRTGK